VFDYRRIEMTIARHLNRAGLALIALSSFGALQTASAAGTAAGTTISNQATVSYQVGGVDQTPITSPAAQFLVDNRIDLTVAESSTTTTQTSPGLTNQVTSFTVTNTGNAIQGFVLSVANQASGTASPFSGGTADNQDVANVRVFMDSGAAGTPNIYDATDTAVNIASLAADATVTVFVLADVPVGATNGQFANVQLTAVATTDNTTTPVVESAGADDPNVVQIVFGDDAVNADATESAVDQYEIRSAALAVTKTATVISDPFNGTSADRKAIPGAVVEYTITVTNSSTTTSATSVQLEDEIPANTAFVPGSLMLNAAALSDSADADAGFYEAAPTPRVVVNAGAVAANNGTAVVTFRVTIQ
jgi:uncharacterized repeat protein (TIGR01451 family)